jgi:hypothetical protein
MLYILSYSFNFYQTVSCKTVATLSQMFLLHIQIQLQKRRERGKINVRGIKLVEPAILHGDAGDTSAPNVIIFNSFD